jgi:hypothetical protein
VPLLLHPARRTVRGFLTFCLWPRQNHSWLEQSYRRYENLAFRCAGSVHDQPNPRGTFTRKGPGTGKPRSPESTELSQRKQERLAEKTSRAPELVVIRPLNAAWTCHRCGGTGDLLMMENPGPACLRCVGLDDLEFLSAGDALLTRRVKGKSARRAVVVRFSKSRRRYKRQGLLVEQQALTEAQREHALQTAGRGRALRSAGSSHGWATT